MNDSMRTAMEAAFESIGISSPSQKIIAKDVWLACLSHIRAKVERMPRYTFDGDELLLEVLAHVPGDDSVVVRLSDVLALLQDEVG